MRTIETTATVMPDGTIIAKGATGIPPGEHHVVIVVKVQDAAPAQRLLLDFPVDEYGPWPADFSLRREDIYDDWGR